MSDHGTLLKKFIESTTSPEGDWWLNIPVGLASERDGEILVGGTREIDALCLLSRSPNLPDEYTYQQAGVEILNSDRLHSQSSYREMWGRKPFAGERAALVEMKPETPTLKGIGQLTAYSVLAEDEWDITVDQLLMVSTGTDPVVERACTALDIDVIKFHNNP